MRELACVILAAGDGTRMKSDLPKVLHTVSGVPMLGHVLRASRAAGAKDIFVVAGYRLDLVRAFVGKEAAIVAQKERRGSGHALMQAKSHLKKFKSVLVLCGDMPLLTSATIRGLIAEHKRSGAGGTVLTAFVGEPCGYGRIVRGANGGVERIVEEANADRDEKKIREINTGAYVFDSRLLVQALAALKPDPVKKEYYLTDVVEKIASQGSFGAFQAPDSKEALGINSRAHLAEAEAAMNRRVLGRWMDAGVTIRDPKSTWIAADAVIGADTEILPFTVIEGPSKIGRRCHVGPFARIRPGVTLGDGVVIGNFVELVRTTVGSGTLVKHLSYLGDSRVGSGVNVGCGTITANFDGKKKHETVIESGAQVGSGTVFVAPARMGKRSKTGAGAIVTRGSDIPAGSTALGIPAKVLKKGKR